VNPQANYYHKAHLAWLKHNAAIVKPCGKSINEVVAYLKENYDTEAMLHEKPGELAVEFFAQHIDADRSSDLYERAKNKLAFSESDMAFTDFGISFHRSKSNRNKEIDRETFAPQYIKIPMTQRNIQRVAELDVTCHTSDDASIYKGHTCCYVLWDEGFQSFYAHGYGSFEIIDDLRFFHGVTAEDIEHLTYRFSRFTQLFPRGDYSMSFNDFRNDMDMCRKYGFYNDQRLFAEMLDKIGVEYEFLADPAGDDFKAKWYERFVPTSLHENAKKHYYFSQVHRFLFPSSLCL